MDELIKQAYPVLVPLAGLSTLALMILGIVFGLKWLNRRAYDRSAKQIKEDLGKLKEFFDRIGSMLPGSKGIAILELLWYIVTIAIPVLGILGGIFGWFAFTPFVVLLGIVVVVSIVLGFLTGHLEFSLRKK